MIACYLLRIKNNKNKINNDVRLVEMFNDEDER